MSEAKPSDSISRGATLPASPSAVYAAWLSSEGHTAMTGCRAEISAEIGSPFRCWGSYIQGKNEELVPGERIGQSWRTLDFPSDAPDSRLTITLSAVPEGTRIEIQPGRARVAADPGPRQYCVRQGWLSRAGAVAICAPNQVSLALSGGNADYDSLNY